MYGDSSASSAALVVVRVASAAVCSDGTSSGQTACRNPDGPAGRSSSAGVVAACVYDAIVHEIAGDRQSKHAAANLAVGIVSAGP